MRHFPIGWQELICSSEMNQYFLPPHQLKSDSHPMQYLGYCMVCNTSNPNHPFNPTTTYFDTSLGHASNPCAHLRFHFSFPFLNFTKTLSLLSLNAFELNLSLSLTLHSLNHHCTSTLSTPSSPLPAYPTQTHKQK